jgi:hypothetical protein
VPDSFTLHLPHSRSPVRGTAVPDIAIDDEDRTLRHAQVFIGVEEIGRHDPTRSHAASMPHEYTGGSNLANRLTLDLCFARSEVNLDGTEVHPPNRLTYKYLLRQNGRVNLGPTRGLLTRELFATKTLAHARGGPGWRKGSPGSLCELNLFIHNELDRVNLGVNLRPRGSPIVPSFGDRPHSHLIGPVSPSSRTVRHPAGGRRRPSDAGNARPQDVRVGPRGAGPSHSSREMKRPPEG